MHQLVDLHRHHSHLIYRPILPHIFCTQSLNLLIQMLPQHRPPTIHLQLQRTQTQLMLTTPTALQILLKRIHALMNFLMLPQ